MPRSIAYALRLLEKVADVREAHRHRQRGSCCRPAPLEETLREQLPLVRGEFDRHDARVCRKVGRHSRTLAHRTFLAPARFLAMDAGGSHDHVVVSAEEGSDVKEALAVSALPDSAYRLVVPPALTAGLAVGDVFKVDSATLRPTVLQRSRNLTVWLYPHGANNDARGLSGEVDALGGTFDGSGYDDRAFIFTLPVDATFPVIEGVFDRFVEQHPGSEWLFGNVYSSDGFTPLGWWETP